MLSLATASRICFLFVMLAASILLLSGRVDAAPRQGQPVPSFKVVSTTGQTITNDNYKGYVTIIDFFATWCQPCRQSIPHLVEINRKYGKQGLQILGLSVEDEGERSVKAFADSFKVNYPVALAGESVTADFSIRSVPVMYLIDRKGIVTEVIRGYSNEAGRSIEQSIKRLLAEK